MCPYAEAGLLWPLCPRGFKPRDELLFGKKGNPMPSVNLLQFELEDLLKTGHYTWMIHKMNEFRTKTFDKRMMQAPEDPYTAQSIARNAAKAIVDGRVLRDPVKVLDIVGPIEFFRAHDGSSRLVQSPAKAGRKATDTEVKTSAGTLGKFWVTRELMENLCLSTAGMPKGRNRLSHFNAMLRACNLVLFEWNAGTHMACMDVPSGHHVAVVAGNGSWRAILPGEALGESAKKAAIDARRAGQLRRMAIDPTLQYVVPLYDPEWVKPVEETRSSWPFLSGKGLQDY